MNAAGTLAEHLSSIQAAPPEALDCLADLTHLLPKARIERSWDVPAHCIISKDSDGERPTLDQLSYDLSRLWILKSDWSLLQAYIEELVNALLQAQLGMQHNRVATHLLPLVQGLIRATSASFASDAVDDATHDFRPPVSFLSALLELSLSAPHRFAQIQTQEDISIQVESSADAAYAQAVESFYSNATGADVEDLSIFTQQTLLRVARDVLAQLYLHGASPAAPQDPWTRLLQQPDWIAPAIDLKLDLDPEPFVHTALDYLPPAHDASSDQADALERLACLSMVSPSLSNPHHSVCKLTSEACRSGNCHAGRPVQQRRLRTVVFGPQGLGHRRLTRARSGISFAVSPSAPP